MSFGFFAKKAAPSGDEDKTDSIESSSKEYASACADSSVECSRRRVTSWISRRISSDTCL